MPRSTPHGVAVPGGGPALPRVVVVVVDAEVPLEGDVLAFGVADHSLAVAAELRVVPRQQDEAGEHASAELLEHDAIAPIAVDLPVRRHRSEVDDAGVGTRGDLGDDIGHGEEASDRTPRFAGSDRGYHRADARRARILLRSDY